MLAPIKTKKKEQNQHHIMNKKEHQDQKTPLDHLYKSLFILLFILYLIAIHLTGLFWFGEPIFLTSNAEFILQIFDHTFTFTYISIKIKICICVLDYCFQRTVTVLGFIFFVFIYLFIYLIPLLLLLFMIEFFYHWSKPWM